MKINGLIRCINILMIHNYTDPHFRRITQVLLLQLQQLQLLGLLLGDVNLSELERLDQINYVSKYAGVNR